MENKNLSSGKKFFMWVEWAKGGLILAVVFHHLVLELVARAPENATGQILNVFQFNTFVPFFMPAFFILTGFTSNPRKGFLTFLWSNVLTLKIPILFFYGILGALALRPMYALSPLDIRLWVVRLFDSGPWFLHALFLSRLMYWAVVKWVSPRWQWGVCLAVFAVGCAGFIQGWSTRYWLVHASALMVFLHIGTMLRRLTIDRRIALYSLSVFLFCVLIMNISGSRVPFITREVSCSSWWEALVLLLVGTTGTFSFLKLCQILTSRIQADSLVARVLETFGKYSLAIYIFHNGELMLYFMRIVPFDRAQSNLDTLCGLTVCLGTIMAACVGFSYLLDRPMLRVLIGKKP